MAATRSRFSIGSVRELVILLFGCLLTGVGLFSNPRSPEIIGVGITLLMATPAVAAGSDKKDS